MRTEHAGVAAWNWWHKYPWRLVQTNLREIDMIDIDAQRYVRDLQDLCATVAMINVGGIIASYPTEVENHFQSPYLQGDSLYSIIEECHRAGIKVIARNDLSKIRRPVFEKHPDWAYRTPGGDIVDYNGDVHTCMNGGYQQEYGPKILREILTRLPVDGVFFNMGGFHVKDYSDKYYGICHCDSCRRRFRESTGMSLPKVVDLGDPVYRAYELLKRDWVITYEKAMHEQVQGLRPGVMVNRFEFMRQESSTEYGRELTQWQYDASSNTRWAKCSMPGSISTNATVDFIGLSYRHVAVSPAQQELRLWQNLANGGMIDYYLMGRIDNHRDRSGFGRVKKVFCFHKKNEDIYADLVSIADVLLVRQNGRTLTPEEKGWIRILTEGHFIFDEVRIENLTDLDLSKYRCVIIPDVRYVSDDQAKAVDPFAANGGCVIITGLSGFYDERLLPRTETAFKSSGVKKIRFVRSDMKSAMFEIRGSDEFLLSLDADFIYFGETYVFADYTADTRQYLGLIPPHAYGPPERCYHTQTTDLPGFTVHSVDEGRVIFLPWLPGELYYRQGHINTSVFCVDLLKQIGGVPHIETNLGPMSEITVQEPRNRPGVRLVSIINMTGVFGNTIHDPVSLQGVSVTIPLKGEPKSVISLRDQRTIKSHYKEGALDLNLDITDMAECILIER